MRALLAAALLLAAPARAQAIYRWTDKHGEVHYTDDPSSLPKGAKAQTTGGEELMVVPSAPALPVVATKAAPPTRKPPAQRGPVEVRLTKIATEVIDVDRQYIEESIARAAASPRLAEWGGLLQSVEVEVAPAEQMDLAHGLKAFGMAVGTNRALLRAPKDTMCFRRPLDYPSCVLHELAHLLEHQHAGQERPRWFAEGFASYVADESYGMSPADVAWWVIHEGGPRPLEAIFGAHPPERVQLAYAIAREGVRFLVERVRPDGVRRMFTLRSQGQPFDAAFKQVAGVDLPEFQRLFIESQRPNYYERAR